MDKDKNVNTIGTIFHLSCAIKDKYPTPDALGWVWFDFSVPGRDGASIGMNVHGDVKVYSYMESHHNGDAYDRTEEIIADPTEMLASVHSRLHKELREKIKEKVTYDLTMKPIEDLTDKRMKDLGF